MIQFNLLPAIKMEYIKAQRNKRFVIAIASIISGVSIAILIVLSLAVFVFQKQHLNDLTGDINDYSKNLQTTGDIGKVLTIQNQLNSLNDLHDKKQAATRIFPYMQQLTPVNVTISDLVFDYDAGTLSITGGTDAPAANLQLAAVNTYVDTLKFTDYTIDNKDKTKAFTDVVLSSFSLSGNAATYTITAKYDPNIFAITKKADLVVPSQVTTRSETEKPKALFSKPQKEAKE